MEIEIPSRPSEEVPDPGQSPETPGPTPVEVPQETPPETNPPTPLPEIQPPRG